MNNLKKENRNQRNFEEKIEFKKQQVNNLKKENRSQRKTRLEEETRTQREVARGQFEENKNQRKNKQRKGPLEEQNQNLEKYQEKQKTAQTKMRNLKTGLLSKLAEPFERKLTAKSIQKRIVARENLEK